MKWRIMTLIVDIDGCKIVDMPCKFDNLKEALNEVRELRRLNPEKRFAIFPENMGGSNEIPQ